jgi:hypothetical protein
MARPNNPQKPIKNNIVVIGEGITETFYLLSIRGIVSCNITPSIPKHSQGLKYLENEIKSQISKGYSSIYCLVDMDTHNISPTERNKYDVFKNKYHTKSFGIRNAKTQVFFIENFPCTELWLFYHFKYTTCQYQSYENGNPLKKDFLKYIPEYLKKESFFKACGGLHFYITEKKKGCLKEAIENSKSSIDFISRGGRGAYSEMSIMFNNILKKEVLESLK